ncbi:MAG TPA: flagellar basal body rod protein FlgF, partial [Steroidobacteraceae bacterium]|nr:flagellar basal body rod protein FlgF [Steroidobacteraceae bacterium]
MDKYLYVAMSGAKETLRAQAVNSHNLANAGTTGFRADLAAFQTRIVEGSGHASRAYATHAAVGWNGASGALLGTGRDLDVAVQGEGWIAVQAADGSEAYTRAGDLRVDTTGLLRNGAGDVVLGDGGPLTVPQHSSISVAADGSVSIVPIGQGPETTAIVGRIKLVNPAPDTLVRGGDGL